MSSFLPHSIEKVIEEFEKLPGVGPKSAARMAYYFIRSPFNDASVLAEALKEMDEKVLNCKICFNVSETEICPICSSNLRNKNLLCVVEEPLDVVAFEKSAIYNGLYFVIGGVISPADGIGPEELRFNELKIRIKKLLSDSSEESQGEVNYSLNDSEIEENSANSNSSEDVEKKDSSTKETQQNNQNPLTDSDSSGNQPEVIIATNPSLEGEATASFISDAIKEVDKKDLIKITRLATGLPTGADLEYADRITLKRALEGRRGF